MATVALTSCARQPSRQNAKKDTTLADDGLRIASLAPSSTSIIVALGLAERLVAVDQWSATLPGVSESALRLDLMRPDVERLAALSPDLLIVPR
jgi:iron complex transport system substrate-binding protein